MTVSAVRLRRLMRNPFGGYVLPHLDESRIIRSEGVMLLLTGPTAAGKNTVGRLLATQQERCAVVDFDLVRAMFVQPHRAPWQGLEGTAQQQLGIQLVCQLALGFAAAGWKVVVLDVVTNDVVHLYQHALQSVSFVIVQLLPSFEETTHRFSARGPVLTDAEFRQVYQEQVLFRYAHRRLDTTTLAPEAVAEQLVLGAI